MESKLKPILVDETIRRKFAFWAMVIFTPALVALGFLNEWGSVHSYGPLLLSFFTAINCFLIHRTQGYRANWFLFALAGLGIIGLTAHDTGLGIAAGSIYYLFPATFLTFIISGGNLGLIYGLFSAILLFSLGMPEGISPKLIEQIFDVKIAIILTIGIGLIIEKVRFQVAHKVAEQDREIAQQRAALTQTSRLASIGEMAAGINHEINNPLFIIKGNLERVRRDLGDHPSLKQIQSMEKSVDRIAAIVSGLRQFTKKSDTLELKNYDLHALMEQTLVFTKGRAEGKGVTLKTHYSQDDQVYCDVAQVEQVLLALISNAVDAVSGSPSPWVEVTVQVSQEWTQFSVRDSGHGIEDKVTSKIFDPFFTTKGIGEGTGLGLSMAQGIARAHGGDLTYALQDGHTTFTLNLPNRAVEKAAA